MGIRGIGLSIKRIKRVFLVMVGQVRLVGEVVTKGGNWGGDLELGWGFGFERFHE